MNRTQKSALKNATAKINEAVIYLNGDKLTKFHVALDLAELKALQEKLK